MLIVFTCNPLMEMYVNEVFVLNYLHNSLAYIILMLPKVTLTLQTTNMQKLYFSLSICIIKILSLNPNNTDQHYYSDYRIKICPFLFFFRFFFNVTHFCFQVFHVENDWRTLKIYILGFLLYLMFHHTFKHRTSFCVRSLLSSYN